MVANQLVRIVLIVEPNQHVPRKIFRQTTIRQQIKQNNSNQNLDIVSDQKIYMKRRYMDRYVKRIAREEEGKQKEKKHKTHNKKHVKPHIDVWRIGSSRAY